MTLTLKSLTTISIIFTLLTLTLSITNNDTHPTSLISTTQTHYIHDGSYFQYSFTNMKLQQAQYNASITQYTIQIKLQFDVTKANTQLEYNLIVFPQSNSSSEVLYQNYVKAAEQGLPGLMPVFPVNYSQPQSDCQSCYQAAVYTTTPVACLKCTSPTIFVNLTSQKWAQFQQWNNTAITIVDNSLQIGHTIGQILLTMSYEIIILYSEEFEALFILYISVISSLIIILGVLAVFITLKIKKVQQEITICKEKNNHEKTD